MISSTRWEVGLCISIRLGLSDRHRINFLARDSICLIELNTLVYVRICERYARKTLQYLRCIDKRTSIVHSMVYVKLLKIQTFKNNISFVSLEYSY